MLDWQDSEDIALALCEKHPDIAPLSLRFSELMALVLGLEEFGGNAQNCNESKLERIQMAWLDEL